MQGALTTDFSFAIRRDSAPLLMDFIEWQALRGALEGMSTRLIADIPCPPEDIYPEDHGCVVHLDLSDAAVLKP